MQKVADFTYPSFNPLTSTLKQQSNGPLHRNTVVGTPAVAGWAVTCTTRRGLGGLELRQK